MSEKTDPDQLKVYNAGFIVDQQLSFDSETIVLHGQHLTIPVSRKFGHLPHIEDYCNRIMESDYIKRTFPKAAGKLVKVRQRKTDSAAHYENSGVIAIHDPKYGLPGWAMNERTVLHELAHHVTRWEHGYMVQGHGREYQCIFVMLLGEYIGAEVRWMMEIAMMEQGLPAPCSV